MKTILQKTIWLLFIAFAVAACSDSDDNCDPNDKESPCYADPSDDHDDDNPDNQTASNTCWYKITIDGQTTLPNQYGQDVIMIYTGIKSNGEGLVDMQIFREKGSSDGAGHFANRVYMILDPATPTGTYPIWFVDHTPIYLKYPVYKTVKSPTDTDLTFTLIENSNRRLHMKVSGKIKRIDKIDGEETYTDYVPLEVEIIVGREHIREVSNGGIMVSDVKCDCQNE